jgi:osmotically-inducible protein OsmY
VGLFSRWFGAKSKYNDTQLVSQAQIALAADPLISDPSSLVVTSQRGVITLSGIVHKPQEKDRIEGVVRSALTNRELKHERIINELKLPHGTS